MISAAVGPFNFRIDGSSSDQVLLVAASALIGVADEPFGAPSAGLEAPAAQLAALAGASPETLRRRRLFLRWEVAATWWLLKQLCAALDSDYWRPSALSGFSLVS
jgi:hypothetical protein